MSMIQQSSELMIDSTGGLLPHMTDLYVEELRNDVELELVTERGKGSLIQSVDGGGREGGL